MILANLYLTRTFDKTNSRRFGMHTIEFYSINPQLPSANNDYTITHYSLDELNFNLTAGSLSLSKTIPKDSSLYIQLDYRPKYLQFEHFPADPNRGFDIPPSIATFSYRLNTTMSSTVTAGIPTTVVSHTSTYSNALLIMPPVPDLSMPFNVISIVCTFFALIIGTTMNLTIRKSRQEIVNRMKGKDANKEKRLKDKLREKLRRVMNMFQKGMNMSRGGSNAEGKEKTE